MPPRETSFKTLAGVPVHYDRRTKYDYGSAGAPMTWACTHKLKTALESCFSELFAVWRHQTPSIILTTGTIGDGEKAHGRGLAFDLDGFHWPDGSKFMMLHYPTDRRLYLGINAHLFLYFPQVLSYHYPEHKDHFHVDFNFSFKFRTASNAQTFFLQACLRYLFSLEIGSSGIERDGVDGNYDADTAEVLRSLLLQQEIDTIENATGWRQFLLNCRDAAFRP